MRPTPASDPVRALAARGHHFIWRRIGDRFASVGSVALFVGETIRMTPRGLMAPRLLVDEMHTIGVQSLLLAGYFGCFCFRDSVDGHLSWNVGPDGSFLTYVSIFIRDSLAATPIVPAY